MALLVSCWTDLVDFVVAVVEVWSLSLFYNLAFFEVGGAGFCFLWVSVWVWVWVWVVVATAEDRFEVLEAEWMVVL